MVRRITAMAGVAALLLTVAFIANYVPARRAEILVPIFFRYLWLRFHPSAQPVEVPCGYVPVSQTPAQMIPNVLWELTPAM
jgi:hypothetical protein